MLALCLMLLVTYYAKNYAGIIDSSLQTDRQTDRQTHLYSHNLARFNIFRDDDVIRFSTSEANTISSLPIQVL